MSREENLVLIAESGATKTDWRVMGDKGEILQVKTGGINPYHLSFEQIQDEISNHLVPEIKDRIIKKIHFYGAGCATVEACNKIREALNKSFQNVEIEVETDLLAAARALCGHEKGIVCILGTGSNSCLFDGDKIVENVPPLGFIIADEGGGTYLGKVLLADFLRKDMPQKLEDDLRDKYHLNRDIVLDHVYNQTKPGRYLAGFTTFMSDHLDDPYIRGIVYTGFTEFFRKNVLKYHDYKNHNVHCTGGVAFHFRSILLEAGNDLSINIKKIVENPIDGLTLYHQPG